jgi:DNA-binding HxlR family transcriptional regulator
MANHERTENRSQPRPPRKRQAVTHDNATTSQIAQIVELDGLTEHLGYLMRRAQIWVFQDFIRTLAAVDIRPRLVHLLNGLEARKFVERRGSKTDRRSHALHLTAKGRSALADIKALAQEHEQHLAERVGRKDHQLLLRLLACFASG